MRFSIVGVQLKVDTRWRSITSTTRSASNFSITTTWSPLSMLKNEKNPLVWYSGPSTRITCGRGTVVPQPSAMGTIIAGL